MNAALAPGKMPSKIPAKKKPKNSGLTDLIEAKGSESIKDLATLGASRPTPNIVPYASTLVNEATNRAAGTSQASAMPTANAYTAAQAAAAAGGGNPAGVGGNGDLNAQTFTGWAKGMRPDAANMMLSNPEAFLQSVMSQMGQSSGANQGLYGMALPQTDYANALYMLANGGQNGQGANGSLNESLNFIGNFLSQGLTPGGQGVDFNSGLQSLMNAGGETPGADSSALADYLNMADPAGQVQAVKSLLLPLANASLHPLFAQALQDKLGYLGNRYLKNSAFGSSPPSNFTGQLGTGNGIWGLGS